MGAHQLPRRAEAALRRVVFGKRLLKRMELAARAQTFNRRDLAAVGPDGKLAARVHRLAVEQYRAGAAFATVATDLRAGEIQVISEQLDQRPAILDVDLPRGPVDGHANRRAWCGWRSGGGGSGLRLERRCRRRCRDGRRRPFDEDAAGESGAVASLTGAHAANLLSDGA